MSENNQGEGVHKIMQRPIWPPPTVYSIAITLYIARFHKYALLLCDLCSSSRCLALLSLISCIFHLFLNSLKNRSFELGYYLFFGLTRAVKTSLLDGLNCKDRVFLCGVCFQSLISLTGVHHNLVILKTSERKTISWYHINIKERK